MRKKLFLLCAVVLFLLTENSFADVAAKIVVANPAKDKTEMVPVKYYLPPEIGKDDILETSGLKVDYDVTKGAYYVYGEIKLDPKEVRTIKISMKDVWVIPEEKFDQLRDVLEKKINASKEEIDIETLTLAGESAKKRLDALQKAQEDIADNIERRMQLYSFYTQKLDGIETDIYAIDKIKEFTEKEESAGIITLMIEAENSKDEESNLPVTYFLPREVLPQHVLESGSMDVKYDVEKDQFYLFKEESFMPNETKRYEIKISNIWTISQKLVNGYLKEAVELKELLQPTQYAEIASMLFNSIKENVEIILSSQAGAETVKQYIAIFRENEKRLQQVEEDLQKLRNLNLKPVEEEESLSKSIQSMLEEIDYLSQLKQMINEFFKQKIRQGNVWKVIFIVVSFVIVMTALFYGWWWMQNKKEGDVDYEEVQEETEKPDSASDEASTDSEENQKE